MNVSHCGICQSDGFVSAIPGFVWSLKDSDQGFSPPFSPVCGPSAVSKLKLHQFCLGALKQKELHLTE